MSEPMGEAPKILAIGDLHIQPDNLPDISVFLQQLRKYLDEHKVDLIVILGDTLHTHETVYTICMNKMLEYVRVCEEYAPTEILVGNHDWVHNGAYLCDDHPFVGWRERHSIVDRVKVREVKGEKIVLLPYVPDGRFLEALSTVGTEWRQAKCIFAHQLLDGAQMGPVVAKGVEKWDETYPLVVSGHIHDKQLVQPNLWYTGSAMQVSFGERTDHTVSLIQLSSSPVITEVDIHPPRKQTIYLDVSEVAETKFPVQENVKLKLSLSGDAVEFKTFRKSELYKKLIKQGIKVVFKQKRAVPIHLPTTHLKTFPDILYSYCTTPELQTLFSEVLGERVLSDQAGRTEIVFEEEPEIILEEEPEIVFED